MPHLSSWAQNNLVLIVFVSILEESSLVLEFLGRIFLPIFPLLLIQKSTNNLEEELPSRASGSSSCFRKGDTSQTHGLPTLPCSLLGFCNDHLINL